MTQPIRIEEAEHRRQEPEDFGLDLAAIGNGRTAALVDPVARLVWWCYPRFNSDPIFSRLLAGDEEKGFCDVVLTDKISFESDYLRNTAIVKTILTDRNGAAVGVTDFAPRFRRHDRIYRPPQLMRIIEPLEGRPRVTIRMRPTHSYGRPSAERRQGSNHISYQLADSWIRLTTDAPLSYIEEETSFVLTRPICMVLGPDETPQGDIATICREALERTREYWMEWVRRLSLAYDWRETIIRAAISLKLSNFEETGGIVAALTTSIPEAPNSGRNWDYRFCWLRDAYFVVKALNRLGATKTMEDFISFILGVAAGETIRPVYSVVPTDSMEEMTVPNLKGYRSDGPVRVGNAAANQVQHDTYGSIILAAMPVFFDRRLPQRGDADLFRFLEPIGHEAAESAFRPDAGIWEYRGRSRVHTYSASMCWAACSRLAAIAHHLGIDDRAAHWASTADRIQETLLQQAWNEKRQAFTAAFGHDDLDASVLLLPEIGLVDPDDPRFVGTLEAIQRELLRGKQMLRYASEDDFGFPESAFLICRFWLIDALWWVGRKDEARELFNDALNHRNRYGLLSEDIHPATGQLWGNFPQTYSMAGLIVTAMRLSRTWEDRYWRG
jgi:GH15 family glucan-1,4-alpha-glucosidase